MTGITKTILEEFDFYETRMWLPDLSGFAITNDDKTIDMYLIKQEHAILEKSIPVPEEIPDEVEIRFKTEDNFITLEEDGNHVFCYFRKSTYSTGVVYEALWDLNLESGTWKKLTGFENDPSPYRGLIITRDFVVTSSEAGLIVYDRMDWHTFPLDTEKLGEFGLGSKLPARYGANTIVLWSKDQEGDESMWIAQINPTAPQYKRVFSVKELGLEDTYNPKLGDYGHYEMFNYAWQP